MDLKTININEFKEIVERWIIKESDESLDVEYGDLCRSLFIDFIRLENADMRKYVYDNLTINHKMSFQEILSRGIITNNEIEFPYCSDYKEDLDRYKKIIEWCKWIGCSELTKEYHRWLQLYNNYQYMVNAVSIAYFKNQDYQNLINEVNYYLEQDILFRHKEKEHLSIIKRYEKAKILILKPLKYRPPSPKKLSLDDIIMEKSDFDRLNPKYEFIIDTGNYLKSLRDNIPASFNGNEISSYFIPMYIFENSISNLFQMSLYIDMLFDDIVNNPYEKRLPNFNNNDIECQLNDIIHQLKKTEKEIDKYISSNYCGDYMMSYLNDLKNLLIMPLMSRVKDKINYCSEIKYEVIDWADPSESDNRSASFVVKIITENKGFDLKVILKHHNQYVYYMTLAIECQLLESITDADVILKILNTLKKDGLISVLQDHMNKKRVKNLLLFEMIKNKGEYNATDYVPLRKAWAKDLALELEIIKNNNNLLKIAEKKKIVLDKGEVQVDGIIYMIGHIESEKVYYIGKTDAGINGYNSRKRSHFSGEGSSIAKKIKEIGGENFEIKIIYENKEYSYELAKREQSLIVEHGTYYRLSNYNGVGQNQSFGGEGGVKSILKKWENVETYIDVLSPIQNTNIAEWYVKYREEYVTAKKNGMIDEVCLALSLSKQVDITYQRYTTERDDVNGKNEKIGDITEIGFFLYVNGLKTKSRVYFIFYHNHYEMSKTIEENSIIDEERINSYINSSAFYDKVFFEDYKLIEEEMKKVHYQELANDISKHINMYNLLEQDQRPSKNNSIFKEKFNLLNFIKKITGK